jgi:type II secretory pathway pseudopilin PulG
MSPHNSKPIEMQRERASSLPHSSDAFTLLEVMIACGIFFIAVFAILALVSNTLRNAQALRRGQVDAGMVASLLFKTNRLNQGTETGDFGDLYPGYSWETVTDEAFPYTNGLWQVDIIVNRRGASKPVDSMSVWVYSPDSKPTHP